MQGRLQTLLPTLTQSGELARLARFALVGGAVAGFYVALFSLLRAGGVGETPANALAFGAAICLQYLGQTLLTFRKPLAGLGQVTRFGLTVGLGYLVSALVTGLLGPAMGWADWQGAALVAVLLPVQNFIIFRLWVYTGAPAT